MVEFSDRRPLAKQYADVSKLLARSGQLPSARELAVLATDRATIKQVLGGCELYGHHDYASGDMAEEDERDPQARMMSFKLCHTGSPIEVAYLNAQGERKRKKIHSVPIAEFDVKSTTFFPNELVERLLEMHGKGTSQQDMHAFMSAFYIKLGLQGIPSFPTVRTKLPVVQVGEQREGFVQYAPDPKFKDKNLFLLWMEASEFTRGFGLPGMLIGTVLGSECRGQCKYALAYTKMARFAENSGKKEPATPEEAFAYFEGAKRGGFESDWGMLFHHNAGAKLLFALPHIAQDSVSRDAGALAVYEIDRLFKEDRLKPNCFKTNYHFYSGL